MTTDQLRDFIADAQADMESLDRQFRGQLLPELVRVVWNKTTEEIQDARQELHRLEVLACVR